MDAIGGVMFIVFAVGILLVFLVQLLVAHQLTLKLREEGLHARGEVVRVRKSFLDSKHRIVEYVFHLPDGSEIRDEYRERPGGFRFQRASEGDSLEVLYLPDTPLQHQRMGTEVGLGKALFGLGILVLLMITVVLAAMSGSGQTTPERPTPTPSRQIQQYQPSKPSRAPAHRDNHRRGPDY
ncbi:DUF3592 domain-containing protein [Corallococcus terminator]|uniref:DUF3592 domain-containing protein n=1 Tax=Corallococcus terminator TaxID=2316733 RepID=A0A3A8JE78_9BACT|nr:DUF3592 domain-containing protein [Corallococcus terminator]RKG93318.1 DUF3592 domain-containing protein [Corallococcus terminator]